MKIEVTAKDANNSILGKYAAKQPFAKWINVGVVVAPVRIEVVVKDDNSNVLGDFLATQAKAKPLNVHVFILSNGAAVVSDDQANTYNKV